MPEEPQPDPAPESAQLKTLTAEKSGALDPQDTVQTAGDRMREHDAGSWPVAEACQLVGMIDEKNPDWKMGGQGHDPKAAKVGAIMKREVIFCYEDEDCAAARRKMEAHGLQVLPVVDREMRIVGLFTRAEVEEKTSAPAAPGPPAAEG